MRRLSLYGWRVVLLTSGCAAAHDVAAPIVPTPPAAIRVDSLIAPWHDTARVHVANAPSGAVVRWTVADTVVATIDAQGLVTGRTGGATVVTATVGDQSASAVVRVEMQFDRMAVAPQVTCARTRTMVWYCWGQNYDGWIHLPPIGTYWPFANGLSAFSDLTGGGSTTVRCIGPCVTGIGPGYAFCGQLSNGRVDCFGTTKWGLATVPHFPLGGGGPITTDSAKFSVAIRSVGVGVSHGCGLDSNGIAYCWGVNTSSQLGAVTPDSTACELGHTVFACSATPVPVETSLRFRQIAAGFASTCAVALDASVWCWGQALLPGETSDPAATPVPLAVPARQVVVGVAHACALAADGQAYCWGANDKGQLGIGDFDSSQHAASLISGGLRFSELVTHLDTTCGLSTDGAVYCWGDNLNGLVGDGSRDNRATPTRARTDVPMVRVRITDDHVCALAERGAAYCWGIGDLGQLGVGSPVGSTIPRQVVTPP